MEGGLICLSVIWPQFRLENRQTEGFAIASCFQMCLGKSYYSNSLFKA